MVVKLLRLFGCNQGFRLKNKGHFHVKTKNENKKRAFADRVLLFTEARIVLLYLYCCILSATHCVLEPNPQRVRQTESDFFQPIPNLPVLEILRSVPEMYVDRAAVR